MQMLHVLASAATLSTSLIPLVVAQAYYNQPLPRPCIGASCVDPNPVKGVNSSLQFQDTTVIEREGIYYRYSKGNDTGLGLNVVTAPSLTGPWSYAYDILSGPLKSSCGSADGQATSWRWAPEVHFINDMYYMYYTVEYPGIPGQAATCFDQCVALSKDLSQDSWMDQGSMNIPNATAELATDGETRVPYVRLDGNLLANATDPQGMAVKPYMVFGSYGFGIYGVPLTDNLLTAVPGVEPELIIADQYQTPTASSLQVSGSDRSGNYTEGPYQLVHGNYVYLFYSRGSCCAPGSDSVASVYQTQVCRTATSNGPTGPYLDRNGQNCMTGGSQGANRTGSIFLYSNNEDGNKATVFAPGSVGVINDPKEGLCMWYQYQNNTSSEPNLGFGYNYLSFDSDEWPILTATRS